MNVLPVLKIRRRTKDANRQSTAIVANIKMADAVFLKQEVEYVCNITEEPVYNPPTTESSVQHLFNSKRRVSVLLCPLTNLIICEPETRPSEVYTSIGL